LSAANTCTSCNSAASTFTSAYTDGDLTTGSSNILICSGAASGGSGKTIQDGYKCKAGYVEYTFTTSTKKGCLSCAGLASGGASMTSPGAGVYSCTAP